MLDLKREIDRQLEKKAMKFGIMGNEDLTITLFVAEEDLPQLVKISKSYAEVEDLGNGEYAVTSKKKKHG